MDGANRDIMAGPIVYPLGNLVDSLGHSYRANPDAKDVDPANVGLHSLIPKL